MTIECEMRVSGTVEFWFSRACNNLPAKYPQVALASLCSIFKSISKTKQLQLCLHKLLELKPSWTRIKALVLIINDEKSKCSTQEPSSFDLVSSVVFVIFFIQINLHFLVYFSRFSRRDAQGKLLQMNQLKVLVVVFWDVWSGTLY